MTTSDPHAHFSITISGTGPRTVVLGNGFGTTQAVWDRLLPWLEERARVVRFDWAVDPRHYDHTRYATLDAYARDLLTVIDATAAAPCILIGHSMSGMIGMLAGRARPEAFHHVVMINPSPRYINDDGYTGGFDRAEVSALIKAISDTYIPWVESFAPLVVGGAPDSPEVREFARGLLALRPDVAMSMAVTLFTSDLRDRLDGYTVPTTILQSTQDPAVPVAVGEYLHATWPGSRLALIDASGHLPHLTHVDRVREALAPILS